MHAFAHKIWMRPHIWAGTHIICYCVISQLINKANKTCAMAHVGVKTIKISRMVAVYELAISELISVYLSNLTFVQSGSNE